MNFSEEHSEQDQDIMNMVETLANKVVERRLEVPAVLMLEMHNRLAFCSRPGSGSINSAARSPARS